MLEVFFITKKQDCIFCGYPITLNPVVTKKLKDGGDLFCTVCGKKQYRKSDGPPTSAQLRYIQDMGGSIIGIKTNGQASSKIDQLKAEKFGIITRKRYS